MATAAELRAGAGRLRRLARSVTDAEMLAEINAMIAELEQRARALGDGKGAN